jgi:hypothetical protein
MKVSGTTEAQLTGLYISPMTALPMIRNAVPWKAVKIRNTKKDAKFGAKAVPMLKAVKRVALATETCLSSISFYRIGCSVLSASTTKHIYWSKRTHFRP